MLATGAIALLGTLREAIVTVHVVSGIYHFDNPVHEYSTPCYRMTRYHNRQYIFYGCTHDPGIKHVYRTPGTRILVDVHVAGVTRF